MKLNSMKCSNCGGNLRQLGNCCVCESCGSSFAIDYDQEDVELKRIELEREKLRYQQNAQAYGQPNGQPYGQPYGQQNGQPYGQPNGQPYGQPYGQQNGQPYGQPYGQPNGQPYGQPYGQENGQPFGPQGMSNLQNAMNARQNMQQFGRPYDRQAANARSQKTVKVFLIVFLVIFLLSFIMPIIMLFGSLRFFHTVSDAVSANTDTRSSAVSTGIDTVEGYDFEEFDE